MSDSTILGYGLITPFRRASNDFETGGGVELIKSSLRTILGTVGASGTTLGELPFNQGLGTKLPFIKGTNLDSPEMEELARYHVVDAIRRNEPRVRLKQVRFIKNRENFQLTIKLRYDIIDRNTSDNRVVVKDVEQEVAI